MIIDTSALIAILYVEEDAGFYAEKIATSETRLMSAGNFLEAAIVVDKQSGLAAGRQFDALIDRASIQIEPVTREQADIARQAYLEFGKGNHPAGLNFGDCFSYALSRTTGLPLLFKGSDFSKTDVRQL